MRTEKFEKESTHYGGGGMYITSTYLLTRYIYEGANDYALLSRLVTDSFAEMEEQLTSFIESIEQLKSNIHYQFISELHEFRKLPFFKRLFSFGPSEGDISFREWNQEREAQKLLKDLHNLRNTLKYYQEVPELFVYEDEQNRIIGKILEFQNTGNIWSSKE